MEDEKWIIDSLNRVSGDFQINTLVATELGPDPLIMDPTFLLILDEGDHTIIDLQIVIEATFVLALTATCIEGTRIAERDYLLNKKGYTGISSGLKPTFNIDAVESLDDIEAVHEVVRNNPERPILLFGTEDQLELVRAMS